MHKWTIHVEDSEIDYSLMAFIPVMYRECSVCGYKVYHLHEDIDNDLPSCNEVIMDEALE